MKSPRPGRGPKNRQWQFLFLPCFHRFSTHCHTLSARDRPGEADSKGSLLAYCEGCRRRKPGTCCSGRLGPWGLGLVPKADESPRALSGRRKPEAAGGLAQGAPLGLFPSRREESGLSGRGQGGSLAKTRVDCRDEAFRFQSRLCHWASQLPGNAYKRTHVSGVPPPTVRRTYQNSRGQQG